MQQIRSPNPEIFLWVHQGQGPCTWPRGWWGRSARGGIVWNWCARISWRGGESSPEEILMVIHRLVKLLPLEYQARLTAQDRGRELEPAQRC